MKTIYKGHAIVCVSPTEYHVYSPKGALLRTKLTSKATAKAFINAWIAQA
jgi:hypothetical protein